MPKPYRGARPYNPDPVPFTADELPRYLTSEVERLANLFGSLSALTTAPKGALRLSSPILNVILDETWVDMNLFDQVTVERGGIIVTPHAIKVQQNSNYQVTVGVNVSLKQSEELDIMMTVNGVHAYSEPLKVQGAGDDNKPVALTWISNVDLLNGDVVAWQARNGEAGSVSVDFTRTNFSVRRD